MKPGFALVSYQIAPEFLLTGCLSFSVWQLEYPVTMSGLIHEASFYSLPKRYNQIIRVSLARGRICSCLGVAHLFTNNSRMVT